MSVISIPKLLVKDLIEEDKNFELVFVDETDTVGNVLQKLRDNNISSVPVKGNSNKIIGSVDILDIVVYCYTKFAQVSEMAWESYQQMEEFNSKKIKEIINFSGRNNWHSIRYNKPLSDLLSMLSNPNIHRVYVTNEVEDIIGLITQSRCVQFLQQHKDNLQPELKQLWKDPVQKCIKSDRPVVSVNMKEFVIKAYKQLWDQNVSALAVIDDNGKIVGNLSASDLKRSHKQPSAELIKDLYQPIKSFLNIRADVTDSVKMANLPKSDPIYVNEKDPMNDVIDLIVNKKIHRVYIIDESKKPVAVVTVRDILARSLERCFANV